MFRGTRRQNDDRHGGLFSLELLVVIPVVFGLVLAIIEFGMIWSAIHQVEAASRAACRVATLPVRDPVELEQAVVDAAERVLRKPKLIAAYRLSLSPGQHTGDPVVVQIQLPMNAAAPDLLAAIGFSLKRRQLRAETVMRKE